MKELGTFLVISVSNSASDSINPLSVPLSFLKTESGLRLENDGERSLLDIDLPSIVWAISLISFSAKQERDEVRSFRATFALFSTTFASS